jgi:uncharacterized protein
MSSKLILGTVQLGLNYGVNNNFGKPSKEKAFDILNSAYDEGIRTLDTAEAYGNSQEVIGSFMKDNKQKKFNIITKLKAENTLTKGELVDHIFSNCKILNIESLEGYMFHNYNSFKKSIFLYEEILKAKNKGIILNSGISLYNNQEIEDIIDNYDGFDFIQIPFNLFDNELKRKSIIEKARLKGIKVHTRSCFLQGLFFKKIEDLKGVLKKSAPYLREINSIAKETDFQVGNLALCYCLSKPYIDKVLIGVDSVEQLKKNINWSQNKIDNIVLKKIDNIRVYENEILNPSLW